MGEGQELGIQQEITRTVMSPAEHLVILRKRQIGMLETIKRKAGPLVGMMPSANMRDRARKIYDLAKELQDDLLK